MVFRKKKGFKKSVRGARKGFRGKRLHRKNYSIMVNKQPGNAHSVIAPVYLTKVAATQLGSGWNSSTASGTVSGITFAVSGNCALNPFRAGVAAATVAGSITNPLTLGTFSGAWTYNSQDGVYTNPDQLQFMGMDPPLVQMYKQFRVLGSKLKITVVPTTNVAVGTGSGLVLSGGGILIVYPYRVTANGSNTYNVPTLSVQEAMAMPYSKWKYFQYGDDIKNNTVELYSHSYKILGMSKPEYKIRDDVIHVLNSNTSNVGSRTYTPVSQQWAFAIMIVPQTGGNTSTTASLDYNCAITLESYVRCENPVNNFIMHDVSV